jgi:hypothetical protein
MSITEAVITIKVDCRRRRLDSALDSIPETISIAVVDDWTPLWTQSSLRLFIHNEWIDFDFYIVLISATGFRRDRLTEAMKTSYSLRCCRTASQGRRGELRCGVRSCASWMAADLVEVNHGEDVCRPAQLYVLLDPTSTKSPASFEAQPDLTV